jgi:hypothetical protein
MAKKAKYLPETDIRRLRACYRLLGSCNRYERDNAFAQIWSILRRHGRNWNDLLSLLSAPTTVAGISEKDRKTLRDQHEVLGGSAEERETARTTILWILERYRCTWNDLLGTIGDATAGSGSPKPFVVLPVPVIPDPLELLTEFVPQFFGVTEDEVVAIALWVIHTYLFDQFEVTPRLTLTSPVPGCGKTTILKIIRLLGATPLKTDGISPAAIYHLIDRDRRTLLIDEAENANWLVDRTLRAVVDSGHSREGSITRLREGEPHTYSTFAPMALATLEKLPLTVIRRSIIIRMKMTTRELRRIELCHDELDIVRRHIIDWAQGRQLDRDPEMPKKLKNRIADNWRVLIAIADACGEQWGNKVRCAAVRLSARYSDDDLKLVLLADTKTIFDRERIDRITVADLIAALIAMEGQPWAEYCGVQGDRAPRRLTTGTLRSLLKDFHICARTLWPRGRTTETKSTSGFYRRQFEEAWESYLPQEHTSTQPSVIKALAGG